MAVTSYEGFYKNLQVLSCTMLNRPYCEQAMTTRTITARTITDPMIRELRREAGAAGDEEQVAICDRALARRGGRGECAEVINACASRRGHYMTFSF